MRTAREIQEAVDDLGILMRSYTRYNESKSVPHRRLATNEFNRARKLLNDIAFHRGKPVAVLITTGEESLYGHRVSEAGAILAARTMTKPGTTLTIQDLIPTPPSHMIALACEDGQSIAVKTEELLGTINNGGRLLLQDAVTHQVN